MSYPHSQFGPLGIGQSNPSNQSYPHIESANSNNLSITPKESMLSDRLLQDFKNLSRPNPNQTLDALIVVSLVFEVIVFYLASSLLSTFSYCFWDFGFSGYSQVDSSPYSIEKEGNLTGFYNEAGCEFTELSRCPGICDLVLKFDDYSEFASYGLIGRLVFALIAFFWMWSEGLRNNYAKVKKIYGITNSIGVLCLIVGTALSLIVIEDIGEPADMDDQYAANGFQFKLGFYFIVLLPVWSIITTLMIYRKLANN